MKSALLFDRALYILYAGWILYLLFVFWRKREIKIAGEILVWAVAILLTIGFGIRWKESINVGNKYFPVTNFYESLVFFVWAICWIFIVLERSTLKIDIMGAVSLPVPIGIMTWTSTMEKGVRPLIPALQSTWLSVHVITSFIGYGAFALAFSVSTVHLLKLKKENWLKNVPAALFDELNYKFVVFGFIMFTLGIITGAAWANYAWGSYWSWDPKETWSLITWLIYGAFLHMRLMAGWKGWRTSVMSIIGFGAVLFTYFGVNFLLSGLHSYASI